MTKLKNHKPITSSTRNFICLIHRAVAAALGRLGALPKWKPSKKASMFILVYLRKAPKPQCWSKKQKAGNCVSRQIKNMLHGLTTPHFPDCAISRVFPAKFPSGLRLLGKLDLP